MDVAPEQSNFVATNFDSLKEAREDDEAYPRAIVAEGKVVGFLMYSWSKNETTAVLYRMMIDKTQQGKGYGTAAVRAALDEIAQRGSRFVNIIYDPDNHVARRLYATFGFVEIGLDEDDEMVARLALDGRP